MQSQPANFRSTPQIIFWPSSWPASQCVLFEELSNLSFQGRWLDGLDSATNALNAQQISSPPEDLQSKALARGVLLSARSALLVACDTVKDGFLAAVEDAEAAVNILRTHCTTSATSVFIISALLREALARACLCYKEQRVVAMARLKEAYNLACSVKSEGDADITVESFSYWTTEKLPFEETTLLKKTATLSLAKLTLDLKERIDGAQKQLQLPGFIDTEGSSSTIPGTFEESNVYSTGNGGGEKFLALERWLHGECKELPLSTPPSSFPYLVGREYSEGLRGVHLRCDVDSECELLSVREEYILTVEKAKLLPSCQGLARAGIDRELSASKHCYLAVYILCTRGDPFSHFAPYYDLFPTSFPNMPLFWGEEELGWLKGSYILEQVEDRRRNILADFRIITRAVPELDGVFSLDDFMWARMIVASRNFGITVDGVRTDALVPYADMLNHLRPRQTRWLYDSTRRSFLIIALQPLAAGQQVFDSYGKKCNSRFLLNYGFTVAHNADDDTGQFHNELRLVLSLPSPASDPLHWQKAARLGGVVVRPVRISTFYDCESTQEAFSFLRFAHAKGRWHGFSTPTPSTQSILSPEVEGFSELENCPYDLEEELVDLGTRPIPPLSCVNEAAVLEHLSRLCSDQLGKYESTLEEDLVELNGPLPLFSNKRNALTLVFGEKTIAQFYLDLHLSASPLLMHKDTPVALEEAETFVKDREEGGSFSISGASLEKDKWRYFKTVVVPLLQRRMEASKQSGAWCVE